MRSVSNSRRPRPVASLVGAALAALATLATLPSCGGSDAGCPELCARDQACVDPKIDVAACTEQCEGVAANDGDYRVAIEARAACYEDASCAEINRGECDGDGE